MYVSYEQYVQSVAEKVVAIYIVSPIKFQSKHHKHFVFVFYT